MLNIIVSTHNEESVYRLLDVLIKSRTDEKIIIIDDFSDQEYFDKLNNFCQINDIKIYQHLLNKDFAAHWNYAFEFIPVDEWVGWFAADEIVDDNFLISLKKILNTYGHVEQFWLPRVNTFYNEEEGFNLPVIDWNNPIGQSYPDYQGRIHRNLLHIRWNGTVHEMLMGARSTLVLNGKEYAIIHHRSHQKCQKSDLFYKEIGHWVYNQ